MSPKFKNRKYLTQIFLPSEFLSKGIVWVIPKIEIHGSKFCVFGRNTHITYNLSLEERDVAANTFLK